MCNEVDDLIRVTGEIVLPEEGAVPPGQRSVKSAISACMNREKARCQRSQGPQIDPYLSLFWLFPQLSQAQGPRILAHFDAS